VARPVYQTADLHEIHIAETCYTDTGEETEFDPSDGHRLYKFRINALKDSRARVHGKFERIEREYNGYRDLIETLDRAIVLEEERTKVNVG